MFFGPLKEPDGRPGFCLDETFSTSPLKLPNGFLTKFDRKQDLNVLYQVYVFFGPIGKTRWSPWLMIAETFSSSVLKPPNGIQRNLTRNKIPTSSTKSMFLGPIRKRRWSHWLLICFDIFNFSSKTAERNSTKLDRKQDRNVLHQVCVFLADWKNKMAGFSDRSEKTRWQPWPPIS